MSHQNKVQRGEYTVFGNRWAKREEAYLRIFREICDARGWTCDKEHFQKFGRYVGMAATLEDLEKESVATHAKLRAFLGDLPGINDPSSPLDARLNDLPCAAEQLDVFIHPATMALIDRASKPVRPIKSLVIDTMNASCLVTFVVVLCSMAASGTRLDPRFWTDSFVSGATAASSIANGTWLANAAFNAAPWIFIGLWACLVGLLLLSRALRARV
jgi:hypothetical protein